MTDTGVPVALSEIEYRNLKEQELYDTVRETLGHEGYGEPDQTATFIAAVRAIIRAESG
jgi:hypothetical protein